MKNSLIGTANQKSGPEYCADCRQRIPAGEMFCPHCGPPNPPEEEPDEGMGFGQTFFRIVLIVMLFGAIAVYKLDLNIFGGGEELSPGGPAMKTSDGKKNVKPHAVDFKTIHKISVARSNLREKPSKKGKILMVLKKGAKVTIVDGNDDWWKIKRDKTTGWISRDDLDTQIR